MKKIPTLFIRDYLDDHSFILTDKVTPGFEWVLYGDGVATVKMDGSCTAIIGGIYYKRYSTIFLCPVGFREPTENLFSFHRPMLPRLLPEKGKSNSRGERKWNKRK